QSRTAFSSIETVITDCTQPLGIDWMPCSKKSSTFPASNYPISVRSSSSKWRSSPTSTRSSQNGQSSAARLTHLCQENNCRDQGQANTSASLGRPDHFKAAPKRCGFGTGDSAARITCGTSMLALSYECPF